MCLYLYCLRDLCRWLFRCCIDRSEAEHGGGCTIRSLSFFCRPSDPRCAGGYQPLEFYASILTYPYRLCPWMTDPIALWFTQSANQVYFRKHDVEKQEKKIQLIKISFPFPIYWRRQESREYSEYLPRSLCVWFCLSVCLSVCLSAR